MQHSQSLNSMQLVRELAAFIHFRMARLTDIAAPRNGIWNEETALRKTEYLVLVLGALSAEPASPVRGCGIRPDRLTFVVDFGVAP